MNGKTRRKEYEEKNSLNKPNRAYSYKQYTHKKMRKNANTVNKKKERIYPC